MVITDYLESRLFSQGDIYGKNKWASRQKNQKSASERAQKTFRQKNVKASNTKEAKPSITRNKKQIVLDSQASKQDFINLSVDVGDYILDNFGSLWLRAREFIADFNLNDSSFVEACSSLKDFDYMYYLTLITRSDLFKHISEILDYLVALGWLKRVELTFKGVLIYSTNKIHQRVSLPDFISKCYKFTILIQSRLWKAISDCSLESFFMAEESSKYDAEFAFLKSQKVLIDLGRGNEVTDVAYDRRVTELIVETKNLLNECPKSERSYYSAKLTTLSEIQSARTLDQKESIREKPFGVLLNGGSGVGKSSIVAPLTTYILKVNDKDYDPKSIITLNQGDKFQSEFRTHHKGVILDDLMNTNLKYESDSPATPIIMFLNNIPMSALNPNAEMKGMVMMEPDLVIGTTNVKDLKSNELSNEPLSINRRFELTITQKVRPEYCKHGTKMLDADKIAHMCEEVFPDYGLYTVEEPFYADVKDGDKTRTGKLMKIDYAVKYFEGQPLIDVDIYTLLRYIKVESGKFYEVQKNFVKNQKKNKNMPLCSHMNPEGHCEECDKLESQMSIPYYNDIVSYFSDKEEAWCQWYSDCKRASLESQDGHLIVAFLMRNVLREVILESCKPYFLVLMTIFVNSLLIDSRSAILALPVIYYAYRELTTRYEEVRNETIERYCHVTKPSEWLMNITWETKRKIIMVLVSLGVWKILAALIRKSSAMPQTQAAPYVTLTPDAPSYHNVAEFWDVHQMEQKYKFGDAGMEGNARCTSHDQIDNIVGKRLMMVTKEDGTACDCLPIKSNIMLLPNHYVNAKTDFVKITKIGGHEYKNLPISKDVCERIPGTDFAVWCSPGVGPQKDLTGYYPGEIDYDKKISVYTLYNDHGKLVKYPNMQATRGRVTTTSGGFFSGLNYRFPEETFGGLCMATLVGSAKGLPFIAGHHLAGRKDSGAAGFVTRKQLLDAIERLEEKPGVFVSHSSSPLKTEQFGVTFGPLKAPHPKCPSNDLPLDAKLKVHGAHSLPGANNTQSRVVTSVISAAATSIMGIPKMHAPPDEIGHVKHKILDMSRKVQTATKFDTALTRKAFVDYTDTLKAIPASELSKLGKIDLDTNLAGLDGVIGINAMNFNTSLGFPLKGPKTKYVTKSDRVVPGIDCPRDQHPMITEDIKRMEEGLLRGESINAIFKGAIKDEPTKIGKGRARVFAAAGVSFVELTRKYFLTSAALFQRNKLITECAVGTVVQSPEWTDLYNHIGKHGWKRAIAGDYQAFDGKMSPEYILLAFKSLIELAKRSGNFDKDDIMIMRGIATEIAYPTYDYFGTILQFHGSNPSGHPLTVIINSIVNSLYMRYTYYAIARDKGWWRVPRFNLPVSMMTYGDDNNMTVAKGFDDFNHTAIAAEFAKLDIVYTMADKSAESVPFINLEDASFLKHFAVWDEELQIYRSPVEEGSIAKMLHTHLRSDVLSMEQSSAEAIQNVALKYFEFGRDVYTKKILELEQVAEVSGIKPYLDQLPSYDERVTWYREKFDLKQ